MACYEKARRRSVGAFFGGIAAAAAATASAAAQQPPPLLLPAQVVLGVLGCPNLPQYAISEADCDEGQAGRSFSDEAVGTMFAACKGQVGGCEAGLHAGASVRHEVLRTKAPSS